MKRIFANFKVEIVKRDWEAPGVFLKARKQFNYKPMDLSSIKLYSMILGRETSLIPNITDMSLLRKVKLTILSRILNAVYSVRKRMIKIV